MSRLFVFVLGLFILFSPFLLLAKELKKSFYNEPLYFMQGASNKKLSHPHLPYIISQAQITIPPSYKLINVSSSYELFAAVAKANQDGNTVILMSDGVYTISGVIRIRRPNIMLLSKSANPKKVLIKGLGMHATAKVNNLIDVQASGFVLDGISLAETPNHLIQLRAETQAHFAIIRNCFLRDAYEQLLKVSYSLQDKPEHYAFNGLIENCHFSYSAGVGPNYYIGGVDAHGVKHWLIRNNVFRDIASPKGHIAEHAIHIWNNSEANIVRNNLIIDSDRGIGFGMWMGKKHDARLHYSNLAGEITSNLIYHSGNDDPYADVGIILENSPSTLISNNLIFFEHAYSNAIEYRFKKTRGGKVINNQVNKRIRARNGGKAVLGENKLNLSKIQFMSEVNKRFPNTL